MNIKNARQRLFGVALLMLAGLASGPLSAQNSIEKFSVGQ